MLTIDLFERVGLFQIKYGVQSFSRTLAASGPLSPLGDIESQEEHSGQHIRMVSWQGIANR